MEGNDKACSVGGVSGVGRYRRFGAFTSSQNPNEIANKVKGTILLFSSIIAFFGLNLFGIEIQAQDITDLASGLGMVAGGVWALYGVVLHLVAKFAERK